MTVHSLKVETVHWWPLHRHEKKFEARKADRDFKVGDTLILKAWDRESQEFESDMHDLIFEVKHMQTFGMAEGYVGLSLEPLAWEDCNIKEAKHGSD